MKKKVIIIVYTSFSSDTFGFFIEMFERKGYQIDFYFGSPILKTNNMNILQKVTKINFVNKVTNSYDYYIFCEAIDYIKLKEAYAIYNKIKFFNFFITRFKFIQKLVKALIFRSFRRKEFIYPLYLDFIKKKLFLPLNEEKVIQICHMHKGAKDLGIDYEEPALEKAKNLTFFPVKDKVFYHVLPFDNLIKKENLQDDNSISVIGKPFIQNLINRDIDDLRDFALKLLELKSSIQINYYTRSYDIPFVNKLFDKIKGIDNINIFYDLDSFELDKRIKKTKFLVPLIKQGGSFHQFHFTGILGLGLFYNKAFIIDSKTHLMYFEGHCQANLIYQNSLLEIVDRLVNMQDVEYEKIQKNFSLLKNYWTEKNQKIFDKIVK